MAAVAPQERQCEYVKPSIANKLGIAKVEFVKVSRDVKSIY